VTDEKRTIGHQPVPNKKNRNHNEELGDFTTTLRVVPISCLAMVIGVICAFVALVLLRLIGLFSARLSISTAHIACTKKKAKPKLRRTASYPCAKGCQ